MICTSLKWDISSNDITGFLLRRNIWEQSNLQCRKSVHAGASTARSMMFTRSATYLGGAATEPIKEERNETNAAAAAPPLLPMPNKDKIGTVHVCGARRGERRRGRTQTAHHDDTRHVPNSHKYYSGTLIHWSPVDIRASVAREIP